MNPDAPPTASTGRHQRLQALVSGLRAARDFEQAAAALIPRVVECATDAAARGRYAQNARLLRGIVHLRPNGGYRKLWVHDCAGSRAGGMGKTYIPSATAWRTLVERCAPVCIDVNLASLSPWSEARPAPLAAKDAREFSGKETLASLLARDTTHVAVLPLCSPGGSVDGMISIEAQCRAAIGHPFIWQECIPEMQLLADVAGPYLTSLPFPSAGAPLGDALLPVVGPTMAPVVEVLRAFAEQPETLLIVGATGVGKSRLARFCHARSARAERPFETLDLLSVPDDLQMAELFGWRRGAFTGAVKDSLGAVARAEGGTLFVDEVDKLSLKAQAGFLRLLEERVYRPVGQSGDVERADVRFVVGTNADLRACVRAGQFREDLYFRVNVLPVKVPTLAERADEIPAWATHMLRRRHGASGGTGDVAIDGEALALLVARPWPGNLRELDNIVRRAYAMARSLEPEGGGDFALRRRHVERALAQEPLDTASEEGSLAELLRRAATTFVREARRRHATGAPLGLDAADAFRGLVLATAVDLVGSRDEAFRVLGREELIANRNHHKLLKRELGRLEELSHVLGGQGREAIERLIDEARGSS